MSKHTPGPWTLGSSHLRTAIDKEEKHIAMVNYWQSGKEETDVSGEEHNANARLIARSPEMAELLLEVWNSAGLLDDEQWERVKAILDELDML